MKNILKSIKFYINTDKYVELPLDINNKESFEILQNQLNDKNNNYHSTTHSISFCIAKDKLNYSPVQIYLKSYGFKITLGTDMLNSIILDTNDNTLSLNGLYIINKMGTDINYFELLFDNIKAYLFDGVSKIKGLTTIDIEYEI